MSLFLYCGPRDWNDVFIVIILCETHNRKLSKRYLNVRVRREPQKEDVDREREAGGL